MFRIVSTQSQFSSQPADHVEALNSLFPSGVAVALRCEPGDPADLMPAEAVHVEKARPKRINEFAAGRACARRALATFGVTDFVLRAASDRQPLWPADFVGSITHTAGLCVAAVVPRSKFKALGLDSERSGAPTPDIWSTLCRSDELAWVESLQPEERPAAATLIFSAKEAVYKCQYPITGEWLDFHDLHIEVLDWGQRRGRFVVRPTRDIMVAKPDALPDGRYCFHEPFVSTAICLPAS
jgi:enterobactin synthetase component D / holo-[acyl-carrier protein] synthase